MWKSERRKRKTYSSLKIVSFFIFSLAILLFLMRFFLFYPLESWFARKNLVNPLPIVRNQNKNKKQTENSENKAQEIKNLLSKTKIEIFSISASDSGFLVELKQGGQVIFSDKKPIDLQVSSLQLILSRLTIEGKGITILDLRFDRPILVAR